MTKKLSERLLTVSDKVDALGKEVFKRMCEIVRHLEERMNLRIKQDHVEGRKRGPQWMNRMLINIVRPAIGRFMSKLEPVMQGVIAIEDILDDKRDIVVEKTQPKIVKKEEETEEPL